MMRPPVPHIASWPVDGVDPDGRLRWSEDEASIRVVMLNILLTRPGERVQRPDFGAGLLGFLHRPNNETTRNLIAAVARKSLARWEPRVVVERVEVAPSPTSVADIHVNVRYRLRASQVPAELGFTFKLGLSSDE